MSNWWRKQKLGALYLLQYVCLPDWIIERSCSMLFAVAMIWKEPKDYIFYYYFCLISQIIRGITMKYKASLRCPNSMSAFRTIPHSDTLPIKTIPKDIPLFQEKMSAATNLKLRRTHIFFMNLQTVKNSQYNTY